MTMNHDVETGITHMECDGCGTCAQVNPIQYKPMPFGLPPRQTGLPDGWRSFELVLGDMHYCAECAKGMP